MALFGDNELSDLMGGVRSLLQQSPALQTLAQNQPGTPTQGMGDFMQQAVNNPFAQFGGMWGNTPGGAFADPVGLAINNVNTAVQEGQNAYNQAHMFDQQKNQAQPGGKGSAPGYSGGTGNGGDFGGGPSTGLAPNVARWAGQTQSTFGDIQGLDPDTMLAIMTNESGGDPNAYNAAGNARGLFQNVGLDSNDPNVQFQAAHQLAQQKMQAINAAYAANGINPDARTRALDFAGAWGGYFNYKTGRFDPTAVDYGVGGQTGAQFQQIFFGNYDKIKAGRQQQAAPQQGGGGDVVGTAQTLLGTPYILGGLRTHPNTPQAGLDCSEFTSWVWGQHGVTLPQNAQQQYNVTQRVDGNSLQAGDLVFFHGTDPNDPDYVTHVGMYIGNGQMINAQDGGVMNANLNDPYWQQHLAGYGRVTRGGGGGQGVTP